MGLPKVDVNDFFLFGAIKKSKKSSQEYRCRVKFSMFTKGYLKISLRNLMLEGNLTLNNLKRKFIG
jgi:hypothetical protein